MCVLRNYVYMRESDIGSDQRDLVDAFIGASRALVAVAARSLAGLGDDITLAQFRALVVLATRGPQRVADLATALAVTPSTASRMVARLVRKGLLQRSRARGDRRSLRLNLAAEGQRVVAAVTDRRREEISRILEQIPAADRTSLTAALRTFADAAGEAADPDWALGWEA
jgi:DNA-binding MarR family transcriptional regulator